MEKILLIVDPQNDFITGTLAVKGAEEAMKDLATYIKEYNDEYKENVVTSDCHPEDHFSFIENGGQWPKHCVNGTEGCKIYKPIYDALIEQKTPLHSYLKGVKNDIEEYSFLSNENHRKNFISEYLDCKIDICGICGDVCVLNTIKDLQKYNADITVLLKYTPSLDGGEKLMTYLKDNNIKFKE